MATKAEWSSKIKSWVPTWFYHEKTVESALIEGLARVFSEIDSDVSDEIAQTFIGKAVSGYLGMHGDERSVKKFADEFDADFRKRVRAAAVTSRANIPALQELLNKIVIRGKASINEDYESGLFFNRGCFLNRGSIAIVPIHNTFTVVVDKQVHEPFSFIGRDSYFNRGAFFGQIESNSKIFELLIRTINENKAFGTLFRIVERTQ